MQAKNNPMEVNICFMGLLRERKIVGASKKVVPWKLKRSWWDYCEWEKHCLKVGN